MLSKKSLKKENKVRKMKALNQLLDKGVIGPEEETECEPEEKRVKLIEEEYDQVKKDVREKRNRNHKPKLILKFEGEQASLDIPLNERTPIFLEDIKHLITAIYYGANYSNPWRWCHLQKIGKISHTTVVYVSGIDLYQYQSQESLFANFQITFPVKVDVLLPKDDALKMLLDIPLTKPSQDEIESNDDGILSLENIFSISEGNTENKLPETDQFSRTKLLLSPLQMVDESYPLPLLGRLSNRYSDYALTKKSYTQVTVKSPMFALDCEMCRTSLGINEITRISIVDEEYKSVYETFVKPKNKIVDYLTQYSGITPAMLENVTKTLEEVHKDLEKILPPDAILVGQSLNVDLHCMKIMHPYVIDTSVIFNITGERRRKSKLKTLAREFLEEEIQEHSKGHDSIEDSVACMKLVKLKLSRSLIYGDLSLINRLKFVKPPELSKLAHFILSSSSKLDNHEIVAKIVKNPILGKNTTMEVLETNSEILDKTADHLIQYDLNISHIDLSNDTKEKTLRRLDEKILNIFNKISANGCLIVIFGGTEKNRKSGAAFVRIKV